MSESMRKLITLVESMDTNASMTFTEFVIALKKHSELNVIRDRDVIERAYELYKEGSTQDPLKALQMAKDSQTSTKFSFESMFEEDESWRLEGRIKSIETQIESGDIVTGDMLMRIINKVIEGQSQVNDAIQEKMRVGINGLIDLIERDMAQLRAEIEKLK